MQPGFKVGVGFANYVCVRMLTDPDPFMSSFIWTVMFSGLTVLFTRWRWGCRWRCR
jgi:ABC-type sugar transport system permease subunit